MIQGNLHDGTQGPPWRCPSLCTWSLFSLPAWGTEGAGDSTEKGKYLKQRQVNGPNGRKLEAPYEPKTCTDSEGSQKPSAERKLGNQMISNVLAGVFSQDAGPRLVLPWYEGTKMPWKTKSADNWKLGATAATAATTFCFRFALCIFVLLVCLFSLFALGSRTRKF